MKSALLFQWRWLIRINLACCGIFALMSYIGSQCLKISFLAQYYHLMPLLCSIFLVIYAFGGTTTYRNLALSMGCRRRDYFWATQAAYVCSALLSVALVWLTGALPGLLGMDYAVFSEGVELFSGKPLYCQGTYLVFTLVIYLLIQPVGGAMGGLYFRHRVTAGVFLAAVIIVSCVGTIITLFVMDGTLHIPAFIPWVILGVLGAACAFCEVWFWRSNGKAVVY